MVKDIRGGGSDLSSDMQKIANKLKELLAGGKQLDIKFSSEGTDSSGQSVDLNEILSLNIIRNPNFGSDSEDPNFTRLIAPYQSNSFVLANPNNYIYYLSKYDFWSFIDAYNTKDDEYLDDGQNKRITCPSCNHLRKKKQYHKNKNLK